MIENLKWLGHASFKLTGEKVIYIDPWEVNELEKANIILITHSHYDHFSANDILKLSDANTKLLMTPDCQSKLRGEFKGKVVLVQPNKVYVVDSIKIEVVPSYNINKRYHPKEEDWVGYVINLNGKRYYHAGDCDVMEEHKNLKKIDIALLPVGGTYTMNGKEAGKAANMFNPKIAVPMHYGKIIGSKKDAEDLKASYPNTEILNIG